MKLQHEANRSFFDPGFFSNYCQGNLWPNFGAFFTRAIFYQALSRVSTVPMVTAGGSHCSENSQQSKNSGSGRLHLASCSLDERQLRAVSAWLKEDLLLLSKVKVRLLNESRNKVLK